MIFEKSLPKANFGQNIRDSPNGSLTADSRSLQTATLNYFNATFWEKVEMEGSGFYEDLSAFRKRRLKLEQLCFINYGTETQLIWGETFAKGYSIRNDLNSNFKYVCNHLIKTEHSYLDTLRKKHWDELASEVEEQTKIDDLISWDEAKDLQYVPVETKHNKTRQKIIMRSAPR